MKSKKSLLVLVALVMISACILLSACEYEKYNIKKYAPAKTAFENEIIDNLNLSSKDTALLKNQDRGFRGEVYITLGSGSAFPDSDETAYQCLDNQLSLYEEDMINIVQCYVYLTEYRDKDLDNKALTQLKEYFEYLRENNTKILMRIAYMHVDSYKTDAKDSQIFRHLDSIKTFINQNKELFNDVVYAVQFGLIGLWGEGHSSQYNHNEKKLAIKLCETIPEDVHMMVRYPRLLSKIPQELEHRFTVHDDFLVGFDHEWGMINWNHPQYQDLLNKNQYGIADGEMPWGRDTTVPLLNPIGVVKQCVDYGLTTLSITHNYKEDAGNYHLEQWKNYYMTEQTLQRNKFPYLPSMLVDGKISIYDYLQYHLGYLLGVSNFNNDGNNISFMINNFGMAAPFEYKLEVLVNDEPIEIENVLMNRFSQQVITINNKDVKSIKIRYTHRRTGANIKLCNDLPYINGENIIYTA